MNIKNLENYIYLLKKTNFKDKHLLKRLRNYIIISNKNKVSKDLSKTITRIINKNVEIENIKIEILKRKEILYKNYKIYPQKEREERIIIDLRLDMENKKVNNKYQLTNVFYDNNNKETLLSKYMNVFHFKQELTTTKDKRKKQIQQLLSLVNSQIKEDLIMRFRKIKKTSTKLSEMTPSEKLTWIATAEDEREEVQKLFKKIKKELPKLEKLLETYSNYEYSIYKFYTQSFKAYYLQKKTLKILEVIQSLWPERKLNEWFLTIIKEGTGKEFSLNTNRKKMDNINENWLEHTRPIVEAFFHSRYFLEMIVKYAKKITYLAFHKPVGWAVVLNLYNIYD